MVSSNARDSGLCLRVASDLKHSIENRIRRSRLAPPFAFWASFLPVETDSGWQQVNKIKQRDQADLPDPLNFLVAGDGFEPPTFGL